jgi:hypothetical protein
MRPIIGVNASRVSSWCEYEDFEWRLTMAMWGRMPLSISAPRSHGKLRSMLTGTGVGSHFRFVTDLELKPAL